MGLSGRAQQGYGGLTGNPETELTFRQEGDVERDLYGRRVGLTPD